MKWINNCFKECLLLFFVLLVAIDANGQTYYRSSNAATIKPPSHFQVGAGNDFDEDQTDLFKPQITFLSEKLPTIGTEGALIAVFSDINEKFDDYDTYNKRVGLWSTNINIYDLHGNSLWTPKTNELTYNKTYENTANIAKGTTNGWLFLGDIGPNQSYKMKLKHNYAVDYPKIFVDRNYYVHSYSPEFNGTTPKLKNISTIKFENNQLKWKKGTNYKSEILKFEIWRKVTGTGGDGKLIATLEQQSLDSDGWLSYIDEEMDGALGKYTYTIYTMIGEIAPIDWKKTKGDAEAGKSINVEYKVNIAFEATQNLSNRIKLEWKTVENIQGLSQIRLYRDNQEIAKLSKTAVNYVDYDIIPGKTHNYTLKMFNSSGVELPSSIGYSPQWTKGKTLSNGRISGTVKTASGVPIENITIYYRSKNMLYNGSDTDTPTYISGSGVTDNTGYFQFTDIYYDSKTDFEFSPYPLPMNTTNKRYRNPVITRTMEIAEPFVKEVNFVDTSIFTVNGYVYYPNVMGTNVKLPVADADIYVNGKPVVKTDASGYYAIPISTINDYTVKAVVKGHTIVSEANPSSSSIMLHVNKDCPNTNFIDQTTRDLYVDVHAYNNAPVGDKAIIRLTPISSQLYSIKNGDTFYRTFELQTHEDALAINMPSGSSIGRLKISLPPTAFKVQVDDVYGIQSSQQSAPFSLTVVKEELAGLIHTVDMNVIDSIASKPINKLSKFVFFGNVQFEVNEKTDPAKFFSQQFEVQKDDDGHFGGTYQILSENEKETLEISLKHIYSYRGENYDAYIKEGVVDITDEISDRGNERITLSIDSVTGNALYKIKAGKPYLDKPYTKNLTIVGYLNNKKRTVDPVTTKAIVVGELNRIGTFYTRTPEKPMFILHDPPGDKSYASLAKGTTKTIISEYSRTDGGQAGAMTDTKIGFGSWTPWTGETGGSLHFTMEQIAGRNNTDGSAIQTTYEFTQEFATSGGDDNSSDAYVGAGGDIYVGNSKNLTYALSDVLAYDKKNKKILKTVATSLDSIGFNSTFIYSQTHIKETLLKQIENLIKHAQADSLNSWQAMRTTGKTDIQLMEGTTSEKKLWETHQNKRGDVYYHKANKESWEKILAENQKNKDEANYYKNADYLKNISFSAGTSYTNSVTLDTLSSTSTETEVFWEMSASVGAYFVAGKWAESDIMAVMGAGVSWIDNDVTENSNSETVTFYLEDDDVGDFFSVDVLKDPAYGTPVFKLRAGTASCPPEEGAQMRAKASIVHMGSAIQTNVPSTEPAKFRVKMANMSESDEMMSYAVRVVSTKNLNGARILFAGQDITNGKAVFDLQAFSDENKPEYIVPIELYKGSLDLEYKDINIVMYPECESDISDYKDAPSKDYITLTATFQNPCSPVVLFKPGNNWIVNQSHNNIMNFVLRDYDPSASSPLTSIRFEIRRLNSNGDWTYIGPTIDKAELIANGSSTGIYQKYFDVAQYPDGDYEIRAVAFCNLGVNYTPAVVGKIDRTSALVFGTPTPANGILTKQDIIGVDYTKTIRNDANNPIKVELINSKTHEQIAAKVVVSGRQIQIQTIDPNDLDRLENETLKVKVWNVIDDQSGNLVQDTVEWEFVVNRSNLYWSPNSITMNVEEGAIGVFTSIVKNKSAVAQDFSLSDFPSWITPSVRNGKVSPQGEIKIDFSIANVLNTGTYSDTVKVVNDGKEQFLYVTVNVLKKAPNWKVNPANYKYQMNIVSQFSLSDANNPLSEDTFDKIAVKVGDEVRGVAHIEYDNNLKKYYAYITAYTNNLKDNFNFYFWDARPGMEYIAKEELGFVNGGVVATVSNPFILHPKEVVQTIPLTKGYNWISLFVKNSNMSASNVLKSMKPTDGTKISTLINSGVYNEYKENMGWVTAGLDSLQTNVGYKIYVTKADTIRVSGQLSTEERVQPLNSGWNGVGYPMPFNTELNTYLKNVPFGDKTRIVSQEEFAVYDASTKTWSGSLKYMRPNQGYKMYTLKDAEVYPFTTFAAYQLAGNAVTPNLSARQLPRYATTMESESTSEVIQLSKYEGGMTTTFAFMIGGEEANSANANTKISSARRDGKIEKVASTTAATASIDNFINRYTFLAYVENQLVGESHLQLLTDGTIRGFMASSIVDEHIGKTVSFKVYDNIEKKTYSLKSQQSVQHEDGNALGIIASPVMLVLEGDADVAVSTDLMETLMNKGESISYKINVKNSSEYTAVNIEMDELIPSAFDIVSVKADKGKVTFENGKWKYSIVNINKNNEDVISVNLKANQVGVFTLANAEAKLNNDVNLSNNVLYGKEIEVKDERAQESNIFIPELISPNGDGINDRFEIVGLGDFIKDVTVIIYDRSSNVVHRSTNYQNNWDGGNFPVGSYGYYIKGTDRTGTPIEFRGYVSIVR